MASGPQINFIKSLLKQLKRTGVLDEQRKLEVKKIREAMSQAQAVEELGGGQASEWIEDLLFIKQQEKR